MKYFQKTRPEIIIFFLVSVALALFLLMSALTYKIGFPLDDAWIHQTYARNLAVFGEWSFIPGETSGGSTSPLWTVLLSLGHLLKLPVVVWPFILGSLALFTQTIFAGKIVRCEQANSSSATAAMIFFALEWHYLWAALSGMETIVYACLITVVFFLLFKKNINFFLVGLLIGLGVWVRPDSITLLGPAVLVALFTNKDAKKWTRQLLLLFAGLLIFMVPYAVFNILVSGAIWPNTFFAKQAEYSELTKAPLILRYLRIIALPLSGAGVLLLPGLVVSIYSHIRTKNIKWIGGYLWWFGINFIYAVQLPVTYQHGRYLIPAMGLYYLAGLIGFFNAIEWLKLKSKLFSLISRAWSISLWMVLVIFCFLGANAYGKDVAIIESEMVNIANWVHENTPGDSIIAAHDIGAIGYFSERKLIDLAGLITPEIIPIIRNEEKMKAYIIDHKANYFITFPGWYPELSTLWVPVYVSGSKFTLEAGEENMVVYQIRP